MKVFTILKTKHLMIYANSMQWNVLPKIELFINSDRSFSILLGIFTLEIDVEIF